jgi:hypothetical protein
MRNVLVFSILVLGRAVAAEPVTLTGEYVEARTASVYAGACHYNGEWVNAGREALLAWRFDGGSWRGVSLAGSRAMAAVSAPANLDGAATRRSELVVDAATDEQAAAVVAALRARSGAALGEVVRVHRSPLIFESGGGAATRVEWPGHARLEVDALPDRACCKMPHLVWYKPFVPLVDRRVGLTRVVSYSGGDVGEPWQDRGANSAFYGSFSEVVPVE